MKVRDIIEAAKKNGLPHVRGSYYEDWGDGTNGACIMGQAYWNLMHDISADGATDLVSALDQATSDIEYIDENRKYRGLGTIMTILNDRLYRNTNYKSVRGIFYV